MLNHRKKDALLLVAVFAIIMIVGPSLSGINNILANQKYDDGKMVETIIVKTDAKNFKHPNDDGNGNDNEDRKGIGQS